MVSTAPARSEEVQSVGGPVTSFVTVVPQAQTYWGSVEIARADLEPELEVLWEERKSQFRQNKPGFRPGKAPLPSRSSVEEEHLSQLYVDKWEVLFVKNVESYLKKSHTLLDGEVEVPPHLYRVCQTDEVTAVRRGDRYLISGVYYLWPAVTEKATFGTRFLDLHKTTLSVAELTKQIQNHRLKHEMAPDKVKRETEGTIQVGDFLEVEMSTDIQQDYGKPAQIVLVEMNDELQYDIREALTGKQIGDVVIMPWKMNAGKTDERHLKRILKVKARIVPTSVSDEEFFKLEGVAGWEEIQGKVSQEFATHQKLTLKSRIEESLLDGFVFGPIPGPWVNDRAEGFYNSSMQQYKTEGQLLKAFGAKDRQSAMQSLLPTCRRMIMSHLAAAHINRTSVSPVTFPPPELADDIRLADWQFALYMELEYFRIEVIKSVSKESP